jgi:hypothetical protein
MQPRTRAEVLAEIQSIENRDRHTYADTAALRALEDELRALPAEPPATRPLAELLASPAPFRAWLQQQASDRLFQALQCGTCPLATFLSEGTGQEILVTADRCWPSEDTAELGVLTPVWAALFIEHVDRDGQVWPEVAPSRCLAILRRVEARLA